MSSKNETNGFDEHKRLILYRLESVEICQKECKVRLIKLEKLLERTQATMRVTAAVIGTLAGLIPTLLAIYYSGRM